MTKKISGYIILILSIIIFMTSFRGCKEFVYVGLGNYFTNKGSFDTGESFYQKVLAKSKNKAKISSNIIKNYYAKKNYMKIVSSDTDENFIKGNSEVKLNESLDAGIDGFNNDGGDLYDKALENYKLALNTKDDINIKKNYEIVLLKQKQQEQNKNKNQNQNQQQQQQQNQKQNQNNNNNQDQKNNQDKNQQNKNQQQNQSQQNNQDNQKNNQKNNENKNNQNNNQDQSQNQKENQNKNQSGNNNDNKPLENSKAPDAKEQKAAKQKQEEMNFVLKQLEGKESKAFKENLKVQVINKSVPKDSNQW